MGGPEIVNGRDIFGRAGIGGRVFGPSSAAAGAASPPTAPRVPAVITLILGVLRLHPAVGGYRGLLLSPKVDTQGAAAA